MKKSNDQNLTSKLNFYLCSLFLMFLASQTALGNSQAVRSNKVKQQQGVYSNRVVMMEVLTRHPSQLLEKLEKAGTRNVVIANPNGIACIGCGFLNPERAIFTKDATPFGLDRNRQGFVRLGEIRSVKKLDARQLERLDLIARGVIKGKARVQELNILLGKNNQRNTVQTSEEAFPTLLVDVQDVCGMHANQIYLVGTEKGLGVNSTNRAEALQGNLTLSENGDLKVSNTRTKNDL